MGGAGGSSIYIDTEGSFVARRASQLASACAEKLSESSKAAGTKPPLTADDLLRGIQYCRVHSPVEFIAMVRILASILQEHPNVCPRSYYSRSGRYCRSGEVLTQGICIFSLFPHIGQVGGGGLDLVFVQVEF